MASVQERRGQAAILDVGLSAQGVRLHVMVRMKLVAAVADRHGVRSVRASG